MITDVQRPRLLPYAATMAPLSKAGDVARQYPLTADIKVRAEAATQGAETRGFRSQLFRTPRSVIFLGHPDTPEANAVR